MARYEFKANTEVPEYYSCDFPLYQQALQSQGCFSTLALLANCRFYGVPAYAVPNNQERHPETIWWSNSIHYGHFLYRTKKADFPSFEEGIDSIRSKLEKQGFAVVSCSPYYLPYHYNYKDDKFVGSIKMSNIVSSDHWLGIHAVDDEALHVYDPVPIGYEGTVSLDDFRASWKGSSSIPELAHLKKSGVLKNLAPYTLMDISAVKKVSEQEIGGYLQAVLKTECYEYLQGQTVVRPEASFYYGINGRKLMSRQIQSALIGEGYTRMQLRASLWNSKWSHMFLLDLLNDCSRYGDSQKGELFERFSGQCEGLKGRWEKLAKAYMLKFVSKKENEPAKIDEFMLKLDSLIEDERIFFQGMFDALPDVEMMARAA